jgi:DNA-binding FadR family transcriptional regulator
VAVHPGALVSGESTVHAEVGFHLRVADAAHNEVLSSSVTTFAELTQESGSVLEADPESREGEIEQHRAILAPIRDREPELAARRMAAHLDAMIPYRRRLGVD